MAPTDVLTEGAGRIALDPAALDELRRELASLRAEMLGHEQQFSERLSMLAPTQRASARNLIAYTTLRRHDIRSLQTRLAQSGLSSLGRSEAHVMVTLDRILGMLALARGERPEPSGVVPPVGFREGDRILAANAVRLLGAGRPHRAVRIVVTLPTEAARDAGLVHELVAAGMDCARINCAHDSEDDWGAMVEHVRRAGSDLGVPCRIMMDLAGPKLRTGSVAAHRPHVRLRVGDRLALVTEAHARRGGPPIEDVPEIACEVPEIFRGVRPGEAIWFDDGKIGGVIERTELDALVLRVIHTRPRGRKLRPGRGINLPDTALDLPALTEKDRHDLRFVCRNADVVALSFAQRESDVAALQEALRGLDGERLGVVLKIETRAGFANLPRLLLAAMKSDAVGVMIARGDLAVEMGFERLAEVQEEILWIAEAAHAPTIWATQVLESLAKKGVLTRAEVTDAAMSGRAEAVMLNKGPFLTEAIRTLDDILGRMQAHQSKKRSLLRPLRVSESL
jgi:pyruvate kinase